MMIYVMMIWWWCHSLFSIHVHGGSGYEWSCTCNISLIRHILYDIVTFSLATGENWRYECTVHSRLVIHNNFPSFVTMKLGLLCYKCKYRSISRDKIISNWSNNQMFIRTEVTINLHWMIGGSPCHLIHADRFDV